jgi:hypothetical protein
MVPNNVCPQSTEAHVSDSEGHERAKVLPNNEELATDDNSPFLRYILVYGFSGPGARAQAICCSLQAMSPRRACRCDGDANEAHCCTLPTMQGHALLLTLRGRTGFPPLRIPQVLQSRRGETCLIQMQVYLASIDHWSILVPVLLSG